MSGTESWSDFSKRAEPLLRAVVNIERREGAKAMDAIHNAARRLGLTERMARSLLYSEPVRIGREKYQQMLARWWADMDRQADALERRAQDIREAAEAARIADRQQELELDTSCLTQQPRKPASGFRGSRTGPAGSARGTA